MSNLATLGQTPTAVISSEPLKICCHVIVYAIKANSRTVRSKVTQPVSAVCGQAIWVNRKLITTWQGRIQGGAIGAIAPLKPTKVTFSTTILYNSERHLNANWDLTDKNYWNRPHPRLTGWIRPCYMIPEQWTWRLCSVSVIPGNKLSCKNEVDWPEFKLLLCHVVWQW